MRSSWKTKIDKIRGEVETSCGYYGDDTAGRIVQLERSVLELLDHVESLSKLVDKHNEYVSQKW